MAKFMVSADLNPGVYRAGVGFFRPGQTLVLPDEASKPGDVVSLRLLPLDGDARKMLVEGHGEEKVKKAYPKALTEAEASEIVLGEVEKNLPKTKRNIG